MICNYTIIIKITSGLFNLKTNQRSFKLVSSIATLGLLIVLARISEKKSQFKSDVDVTDIPLDGQM